MSGIPITTITFNNLVDETTKIGGMIDNITLQLSQPKISLISEHLNDIKKQCNIIKQINVDKYFMLGKFIEPNEVIIIKYIEKLKEYKENLINFNFTRNILTYKSVKFSESSKLAITNLTYYPLNILLKQLKDLLKDEVSKYNEIFENYKSIMIPYYKKKHNNIIDKTTKLLELLKKYRENIYILKQLYKLLNKHNILPNINIHSMIQHIISSIIINRNQINNNIFGYNTNYYNSLERLNIKKNKIIRLIHEMLSNIIKIKITNNISILTKIIESATLTMVAFARSYIFGRDGEIIINLLKQLVENKDNLNEEQIRKIRKLFTELHISLFEKEAKEITELLQQLYTD